MLKILLTLIAMIQQRNPKILKFTWGKVTRKMVPLQVMIPGGLVEVDDMDDCFLCSQNLQSPTAVFVLKIGNMEEVGKGRWLVVAVVVTERTNLPFPIPNNQRYQRNIHCIVYYQPPPPLMRRQFCPSISYSTPLHSTFCLG